MSERLYAEIHHTPMPPRAPTPATRTTNSQREAVTATLHAPVAPTHEETTVQAWIVAEGQTTPYDPERLPPRDRYGWDWIYVEAPDRPTALAEAQRYDSTRTTEETLFAVGYRNGALSLPGDRLVSTTEVARQAHTTPGTVRNWRQRHPTFPEPAADLRTGPIWWWSDVAAWLAIPRPAGRPRRLTRNP